MKKQEIREINNISNQKSSVLSKDERTNLLLVLDSYPNKFDIDMAIFLINSGKIQILAKNLSKFTRLTNEIANKLIKNGYEDFLAKDLGSFQNLDKKIATILIVDRTGAVANNLKSFKNLDDNIAQIMIENKYYDSVAANIYCFKKLSKKTLLALLINCTRHKEKLVKYRSIFGELATVNHDLLNNLMLKGKESEYLALKEFYDKISFIDTQNNYESNHDFSKGFNIEDAKDAIRYRKGEYLINYLDKFEGNYTDLIKLLIKGSYLNSITAKLPKLRGKDLDWNFLVIQLATNNYYNEIIRYSENFEREWISNLQVATYIIKYCNPEIRYYIKKLNNYSEEDSKRDWINYNLDIYNFISSRKIGNLTSTLESFKTDYPPTNKNTKLPKNLYTALKNKIGYFYSSGYENLFE